MGRDSLVKDDWSGSQFYSPLSAYGTHLYVVVCVKKKNHSKPKSLVFKFKGNQYYN